MQRKGAMMKSRFILLLAVLVFLIPYPGMIYAKQRRLPVEDTRFLQQITADVVEKARIRSGVNNNTTGGTLICPGGFYPAFWIRDYTLSLESGKITPKEQQHALILTAARQQEKDWKINATGAFVPQGSIADHINYDGNPIFYPGTYDYNHQGGDVWGILPSLDDHYFFIHMAWYYIQETKEQAILNMDINGRSLIERLELAFQVPPSDPQTHLLVVNEGNRGVSFGFMDSVRHTGNLLFGSVLKYRAACELSEMYALLKNEEKVKKYKTIATAIKNNISRTFPMVNGLFRASTGKSNQPCVWGSAFAVYVGAVESPYARLISHVLCQAYKEGTLTYKGQVRHLRTTDDYDDQRSWDTPVNGDGSKSTYQHGAYWGTPLGWVCYSMAQVDEDLALKLAKEYIQELRQGDYRKGEGFGSPWECMHPKGNYKQNSIYMTSVTCPLAAFKRLGWLTRQ
ncbi:MAG: hypothetical protein JXD22_10650 [Sedimentisphaerales bacterium]|nr:hypothetical protein [Sedimentisphaerales bacterium]